MALLTACGQSGSATSSIDMACQSDETESETLSALSIENQFDFYLSQGHKKFIVKKFDSQKTMSVSEAPRKTYKVVGVEHRIQGLTNQWDVVEINSAKGVAELKQQGNYFEQIESIEPDYPLQLGFSSSDPLVSKQWSWKQVDSERAWDLDIGKRKVVVAVIDSGIDIRHRDLVNNIWKNSRETLNGVDDDQNGKVDDIYGWDFAHNDASPLADSKSENHGTHVSGIIGAQVNNAEGILGQSPNVLIMPLRFIKSIGTGSTSDAIRAIDYAIEKKADIINASWGGSNYSKALFEAVERSRKAGILFVTAAGNNGQNLETKSWYPALYPSDNILSVAASAKDDQLTSFSNYGRSKVDVAAPGLNIFSTYNQSSYGSMSGTSMASPLVAGLAAHVKSVNDRLDYKQIKKVILASVDRQTFLTNKVRAGGRVNAYKAIRAANDPGFDYDLPTDKGTCP
ncbi:MAG: S8 family peptidase [Bdellovibrionales bacterium]